MKITIATSDVTTITLNTDTLANRPVYPITDDDEGVELTTRPIVDEEYTYIHTYIYTYIHIYIHIQYTYIHTYTHTYMHIYIHT